jgi:hypothetical protein
MVAINVIGFIVDETTNYAPTTFPLLIGGESKLLVSTMVAQNATVIADIV